MTDGLCQLSAVELRDLLRSGEVSSVEITSVILERIEAVNPRVNCFVTITNELALERAAECDRERATTDSADLPPLHGLPLSVKDLNDTAGVRTTYGSWAFADYVPEEDGRSWGKLKDAGAVLIGKTTTPEFGLLGVTESPLTGVTNNPWDLTRTAGGSSGGAAAAVAAGLGPFAWGSDGSGSIRIPAACCGVVGLKPSIGRVSGYGEELPYDTVDCLGPLARTVADVALLLSVTAGPDPRDPIALPASDVDYLASAEQADIAGKRVAVSLDLGYGTIHSETRAVFEQAVTVFERELGATVELVGVSLPNQIEYFLDYWAPSFTAMVLDEQRAMRGLKLEETYPIVRELAERAGTMSAVDWWRTAHETRAAIATGVGEIFRDYDLLLTPTMPLPAFPHPGVLGGNRRLKVFRSPTQRLISTD